MPGQGAEFKAGRGAGFQRGKDYQPAVTSEQLGLMVGNSLNALIEAIHSGNSARLTSYLAFSGRFHRYSRRNQQLIYEQCPQATRVASYATWKKEGFQVRKMEEGEKGIRILRPIPPTGYRRAERAKSLSEREEKAGDEYKETEVGFITRTFRVGTVFDVTHLIPQDQARVPKFFTDIEGDHQAVYDRLVQAVRANGIAHRESLETHGARGYSAMGLIVVRPDQPVGNKAAVTAYEWGHELLHKEAQRRQLPSQVKECHAEATAFVVMSHFGITIPYSADYLINWGNTVDTLRGELDLVTAAASQIITKVDAFGKGEKQFDDGEQL